MIFRLAGWDKKIQKPTSALDTLHHYLITKISFQSITQKPYSKKILKIDNL
jgi:hypothetical protein